MGRPRILYLTRDCPGAPRCGGQIRALHIGKLLQRTGDVTVVVVPDRGVSDLELSAARAQFGSVHVLVPQPTPIAGPRERLRHELDPTCMNTVGVGVRAQDTERVRQLLREHDFAWVHRIWVADALRIWSWGRAVLDIDDLLSGYHTEITEHARGVEWLRAWRSRQLWRRREARIFERFQIAAICSEQDRPRVAADPRLRVIPNGFERPPATAPRKPGCRRVGFLGLIHQPANANLQGLRWFMSEVWPEVLRRVPDAELRMVGKGTDSPVAPSGPRTVRLGWLDDVADEMSTWSASIVPVQHGSGTRIKIVEAFARGIPLVSTRVGAYGYPVEHERELLLADEPAAFASSCARLLRDPDLGDRLAARARRLFDAEYTWDSIAPAVAEAAALATGGLPARVCAAPPRAQPA